MKAYGIILISFCSVYASILALPYSELSGKGIELTFSPILFLIAILLLASSGRSKTKIRIIDVFALAAVSIVAGATFYLPDPNSIWIMFFFIVSLLIPAYLILLTRGVIFVFKEGAQDRAGAAGKS